MGFSQDIFLTRRRFDRKRETHHTDEDIAAVPEGGEDVVHELLVPESPLGLVVGGVVAVSNQQAGPR